MAANPKRIIRDPERYQIAMEFLDKLKSKNLYEVKDINMFDFDDDGNFYFIVDLNLSDESKPHDPERFKLQRVTRAIKNVAKEMNVEVSHIDNPKRMYHKGLFYKYDVKFTVFFINVP